MIGDKYLTKIVLEASLPPFFPKTDALNSKYHAEKSNWSQVSPKLQQPELALCSIAVRWSSMQTADSRDKNSNKLEYVLSCHLHLSHSAARVLVSYRQTTLLLL